MRGWRDTPTLIDSAVTLRPLTPDDRDALIAVRADGLGDLFFTTVPAEDAIDGWLAHALAERDAGRAMPFAVIDAQGQVAGTTRFMRMAQPHRRVEIGGTWYARRVWRTALNSQAKRLLLAHAFDVLDCLCVQLRTDWLNHRSQRAIERLGAKRDGVLRNHVVMPDGHMRDTVVYSIIAGEWPGVRRNLDRMLAHHGEAT